MSKSEQSNIDHSFAQQHGLIPAMVLDYLNRADKFVSDQDICGDLSHLDSDDILDAINLLAAYGLIQQGYSA